MKKTVCFIIAFMMLLTAVILHTSVFALLSGDVDGSGEVNNKDVVILFRYVTTNDPVNVKGNCDINSDGSVDNKDVVTLFRRVSGENTKENSGEIELPDVTLRLNSVEYDEKGADVYFDAPELKTKLASFSNKIFNMSVKDENGNYTVSPLSAYMALAILNAVGDEGVKSDIELLFGMDQADIDKTKSLFLSLVKECSFDGSLISKLDLTNSVWIDSNRKANKETVEMLADKLFCYAYSTPFSTDIAKANKSIRAFIANKTKGLIDTDFDLDANTVFAIINTLYLKDVWGEEQLSVTQRPFKSNGKQTQKDFLTTEYFRGEVAETDKAEYFSVRTGNGYNVKFILPKNGYTLKQAMTNDALDEINSRKDYTKKHTDGNARYTRCIFPKFRIESETDMKKILEGNGYLQNAFSGYTSNLLDGSFAVSDIIHKAVVNVDEKGVEGAAVTVIAMKAGAASPIDEKYCSDFILDCEFGFMITTYDGVTLFEGTVVEP